MTVNQLRRPTPGIGSKPMSTAWYTIMLKSQASSIVYSGGGLDNPGSSSFWEGRYSF